LALVVLSKMEQRLVAVRAVLAGARVGTPSEADLRIGETRITINLVTEHYFCSRVPIPARRRTTTDDPAPEMTTGSSPQDEGA
jgi:hypothetical protein